MYKMTQDQYIFVKYIHICDSVSSSALKCCLGLDFTPFPFILDLLCKDVFGTPCTLAAVVIGDPSCTAFIASNIACSDHCSRFLKGLLDRSVSH